MALTKTHNRMIQNAPVNVKDVGAVGDGVADDTAAITSALVSGAVVYIPKGTYKITSSISLNDVTDLFVFGDGEQSKLVYEVSGGADMLVVSAGNPIKRSTFRDICFFYATTTDGAPALTFNEAEDILIENCVFDRSQLKLKLATRANVISNLVKNYHSNRSGIVVANATDCMISNNTVLIDEDQDSDDAIVLSSPSYRCSIIGNVIDKSGSTTTYTRTGINLNQDPAGDDFQDIVISGNVIYGIDGASANSQAAIKISTPNDVTSVFGLTISGNAISDCKYGVWLDKFFSNLTVDGNSFSNCEEAFRSELGGYDKSQFVFSNNTVSADSTQTNAVRITQCDGAVLTGNTISNYTDGIVTITQSMLTVSGNHFNDCDNAVKATDIRGLVFNSNIHRDGTNSVLFVSQGFAAVAGLTGNIKRNVTNFSDNSGAASVTVTSTANLTQT